MSLSNLTEKQASEILSSEKEILAKSRSSKMNIVEKDSQKNSSRTDIETDMYLSSATEKRLKKEYPIKISDQYEFLSTLGSGSFGTVGLYKWVSSDLTPELKPLFDAIPDPKYVALKIVTIRPNVISIEEAEAEFAIIKELKTCSASEYKGLYSPCYINHYFQVFDLIDGTKVFTLNIVSEFLKGISLHSFLSKNIRGKTRLMSIMVGIANSVDYIHKRGFAHKDLKIENIMYETENIHKNNNYGVKLIDFGLSCSTFLPCVNGGTISYMPLELLSRFDDAHRGKSFSLEMAKAGDIWSIGIVFYLILELKNPFEAVPNGNKKGDDLYIANVLLHKKGEYVIPFSDYVTPTLKRLILKMLDSDMNRRIKSTEVKNGIHHVFNNL